MTERKEDMGELLHITNAFGWEWDMKFSEIKCKVVVVNGDGRNQWVMGNSILETVDKYVYLGLEVNGEGIGGARQRSVHKDTHE